MSDSNHQDYIRALSVENNIRESTEEAESKLRFLVSSSPKRIPLNRDDCFLKFSMERQSKSYLLLLVIAYGLFELGTGFDNKNARFQLYFSRRSFRTFSAGIPTVLPER